MKKHSKGDLLGVGRTAEIFYWKDNEVLKLFHKGYSYLNIKYEYETTKFVHELFSIVPSVYELIEWKERKGIVYEFIEGETMTPNLIRKPWKLNFYAKILAELHIKMHKITLYNLKMQKDIFQEKIYKNSFISRDLKKILIAEIEELYKNSKNNKLCHGDFHTDNIILKNDTEFKIIDWDNCSLGSPEADVARTIYLIKYSAIPNSFSLFEKVISRIFKSLFCSKYLKSYLKLSRTTKYRIEKWLPIIFACRLSENISEEHQKILSFLRKYQSKKKNQELK